MNRIYRCGKFPRKICQRQSLGGFEEGCSGCKLEHSTIKQYISRKKVWDSSCNMDTPYRYMNVTVVFLHSDNTEDETEFCIRAYDINELSEVYNDFCKQNGYPRNTVKHIIITEVADIQNKLS